jgi:hypothetical protein
MSELYRESPDSNDATNATGTDITPQRETGHKRETTHDSDSYGYRENADTRPDDGDLTDNEPTFEGDDYQAYEAVIEARLTAEDQLPTRQESRAYTWSDAPDSGADDPWPDYDDPAAQHDEDLDTFIAEQDRLPIRQQARAYTWGDAPSGAEQEAVTDTRTGASPLTSETGAAAESPAHAQHETAGDTSPDPQTRESIIHDQRGHDTLITVVRANPEDRTLHDDTPTGIGLKPTGDQLLQLESDSRSYLERLRRNIYERADDISDAADEYGGTLGQLFEHPPTETHTEVPNRPPEGSNRPGHGIDTGHMATAGLVISVLSFELFRTIKNRVDSWRRR